MLTAAASIQLTAEEVVFLFELMEIPESGQLMSDYGLSEDKLMLECMYENVIRQLEDAELLSLDGKRIILEFSLLELLKTCKSSSAVVRLELHDIQAESSVIYGFIAGSHWIELRCALNSGEVQFTRLENSLDEQISRLGMYLRLSDEAAGSDEIQVPVELLLQVQELLGNPNAESYQNVLRDERLVHGHAVDSFVEACCQLEQWGRFEAGIRMADIQSNPILYLGSPAGNWLFIQEGLETARGYRLDETEMMQSLYLITTRTLSLLSPVK